MIVRGLRKPRREHSGGPVSTGSRHRPRQGDQRKGNRAGESIDPGRGRGVSANHRVTNDHGLFLGEDDPDAWWPDDVELSLPFCG